MTDDSTPGLALAKIHGITDEGIRALMREDYREVMFQLDHIREHCSWVEKMMWRRLHPPQSDE